MDGFKPHTVNLKAGNIRLNWGKWDQRVKDEMKNKTKQKSGE